MSPEIRALPLAALIAAWLLLLAASWERAARRRREGDAGPADPLRPPLATLHAALEVRLSVWLFFASHLWWLVSRQGPPDSGTGAPSPALLLAGIPAAGLAVLFGRTIGRRFDPPGALRWPLAPVHGLTAWVLWLRGLIDRRGGGGEPAATPAPLSSSPGERVRDLASLTLAELMIPRSQVMALDGGRTLREVLPEVRRRPHSLYPVYEGVIDQPLGVVRILELSEPESADQPLRERVHPVAILPETVRGLRLLRDLARAPIPAALVVDEFGSMAGLVTIEDLMEVVIGDLEGEHEIVRARILSEGDGAWRIEGACTVEEFRRRFGPLIPEGEYETVAGFFLDRRGEIPEAGAELALPGLRLEVMQASERRIVWLRAEVSGAAGAGS